MDVPNYDGRIFRPIGNPPGAPTGRYHQNGTLIWAEFGGGRLHYGRLVGTCDETGTITATYCQLTATGEVTAGEVRSVPGRTADGVLTLTENWHRLDGSTGVSVIEEVDPSLAPADPTTIQHAALP
ncbi:hypothetical protein FB561_0072 [Kribbella amoyensis]|uniref:Uncharacterized protein n=1 Tax=Kribbella amoyensis TaxID=996641 RepID=A0A561BJQ3_9ACTN|nr:hypothetical protein [Kribbella amoyensis]TWD79022.1 hypothetical protein FB561_0072 [Kribbella amoyensis]